MNLDKDGNWDGVQGIDGDDVVMGCCYSNIRLGTGIEVGKEGWVNGMDADGGASVLAMKGGAEGRRATSGVAGIWVSTSLVQLQMVELTVTGFEANTLSTSIFCIPLAPIWCIPLQQLYVGVVWPPAHTVLVFVEIRSLFAPNHAHVALVSVQTCKLAVLAHAPKSVV